MNKQKIQGLGGAHSIELRDLFAMAALVGMIGNDYWKEMGKSEICEHAYYFADGMLEVRTFGEAD